MLGRHEARKHGDAARAYDIVMIPAAEIDTTQLEHRETAADHAIGHPALLQAQDAVDDAMQLKARHSLSEIIERQHRALTLGEEALQGQDLTPGAQGVLGQ